MAVVGGGGDGDGGLAGLKIVVSPELVSGGDGETKMFVLIPPYVRSVREFKSHLASTVLKTSLPFYFYNGDFRIPDEDDVQIFSLLEEPCRVVPVPQRRSALMCSTPMGNRGSTSTGSGGMKRVQFFDTTESSDESIIIRQEGDMRRRVDSGADQIDNLNGEEIRTDAEESSGIEANSVLSSPSKAKRSKRAIEYDDEMSGAEILEKKKAKRRRRHKRKKKNSSESEDNYTVENMELGSFLATPTTTPSDALNEQLSMVPYAPGEGVSPKKNKSRRTRVSTSDEDMESDVSGQAGPSGQCASGSSNSRGPGIFQIPSSVSSDDLIMKDQKNESGVFLTPTSIMKPKTSRNKMVNSSTESIGSSIVKSGKTITGKRQDTPILPRVLKNPGINIEAVRRSLSVKLAREEDVVDTKTNSVTSERNTSADHAADTRTQIKANGCKPNSNGASENINLSDLASLPEVSDIGMIDVGNVIAFKVLELNEIYTPVVSPFKVARVIDKIGEILSLDYIKTDLKTRSGALEIEDEDLKPDYLDDPPQRSFKDLLQVRVVP